MINSFEPIIDNKCSILILGSMPGVESLRKNQYYGYEKNQFWKILFDIFQCKLTEDYDKKKEFLLKHHIALWDVIKSCSREGSSDSKIKDIVPNDLSGLLNDYPNIKCIIFNGKMAAKTYDKFLAKRITDIYMEILPSTSPANTVKFEEKLDKWRMVILKQQQFNL